MMNILDRTALKCAIKLVKAVTKRLEYVIVDAILDGGDSFVTKVI